MKNDGDGKRLSLKRHFTEHGGIIIEYSDIRGKILKIYMEIADDKVDINLFFSQYKYDIISDFIDFFRDETKQYHILDSTFKIFIQFPISEIDNVISDIEKYYLYLDAKKYNL